MGPVLIIKCEPVAMIVGLSELNIGHAIVGRALFTGLPQAVKEMKALMLQASALAS